MPLPGMLSRNDLAILKWVVRAVKGLRGPGITNSPTGISLFNPPLVLRPLASGGTTETTTGSTIVRARIKAIYNDYLEVKSWNGTTEGANTLQVAKNFKSRHVLANFPGVTSIASVDTQTIDATTGASTERWYTTPSYNVNDEIWAESDSTYNPGVTVASVPLTYRDRNEDARAWSKR